MAESSFKLRKLSKNCTLTVTIYETREFRLRRALAIALIRAAGWILGMRVAVTTILLLVLLAWPASAQPSLLADVQAERARFGAQVTADEVCTILARVVRGRPDFGLLLKPGGAGCTLPDGRRVSGDIIVYAPQAPSSADSVHYDVLYDWDGSRVAKPKWDSAGPCEPGPSSGCEMSRFTRVAASMRLPGDDSGPVPTDGPGPVVPAPEVTALVARVEALERTVQALGASVPSLEQTVAEQADALARLAPTAARVEALAERVSILEGRPIPVTCTAALNLGAARVPISCRLQ